MSVQKRLTFNDSTAQLLDELGRDQSSWVEMLIERAVRRAMDALGSLTAAGWTRSEMLAALDVLNGHHLLPGRPTFLAAELADAQRLNDVAGKWEIEETRWSELVRMVRDRPELQAALSALVEEFWGPPTNPWLARRLEA